MGETFVEHHRNVRSKLRLDVCRFLRREHVLRSIEMRSKPRALFGDRPPLREAEHLIAAAVGKNRLAPADKTMQSAATRDQVVAGTQIDGEILARTSPVEGRR